MNKDKKVAFIRFDEYVTLERYSEFIWKYHNMNTIVQTTGGDTSSLNRKSEIPNNTLTNIKRYLLLKSSQKKEIWCFTYKYAIGFYC